MNESILKNNGARQLKFNPEITLGNILQLVSMAGALIALWTNMDKRLTAVELRQSYATEESRELKKSMATLTESQALLARTVDRITIVLEQRTKGETK